MTEKLYYSDSFLEEFDAIVLSCEPAKDGYLVTLDRTAFYPEGGGQPSDIGTLGGTEVTFVRERDGIILHSCREPLEVGSTVHGKIDFPRRFGFMQQHSGEHILSGFLHNMYGLENVGFHMGADAVTIDTSAVISADELAAAERAANEYIALDREVICRFPSKEELAVLPYRSKKELSGEIRIVEFPGADICACCGTHVARAGQVGFVKILSFGAFRSGLRIELLCGLGALEHLSAIYSENSEISRLLSAKPLETSSAVARTLDALAAEKARSAGLEEKYFALRAAELRGNESPVLFEDGLSSDSLRRFADMLSHVCGGRVAVFTEGGSAGAYRYAIAEQGAELLPFAKELNAALHGRGGGRGGLIQGSVNASRAEIEAFFGVD